MEFSSAANARQHIKVLPEVIVHAVQGFHETSHRLKSSCHQIFRPAYAAAFVPSLTKRKSGRPLEASMIERPQFS